MTTPARYALRRTLPPWRFDKCLAELLDFCQTTHTDEVIVKIDAEEFSHGIPTVEWLSDYLPKLATARDALAELGVQFSLNPWVTVGHCDRGRDLRGTFPKFQWMVGQDDTESRACACPLSDAWLVHTQELWRMYASLQPRVLWVEDDIRTFNHLPVEFGCFCQQHLAEFNRRIDTQVSRDELLEALLQPGQPHTWREAWLDMQRDVILEVLATLATTVHKVAPQTSLGIMSSGPEMHCLEGRDWTRLADMLGDGRPLYSRPTLGSYSEGTLLELYGAAAQIKRTRYVLPANTIEQTEIENVPFTSYSKSATFTFLQLALSLSHGCHGATLNLFDHLGSSMCVSPGISEMLSANRAFAEALAETHAGGIFRGVRILHHPRASYVRHLKPNDTFAALAPDDYSWEYALNALGITTTYTDAPVTAASGQMIACFDDTEIHSLLSNGLLLDLEAAETLIERGFGEHLGVTVEWNGNMRQLPNHQAIAAEALTDTAFGGGENRYLTATLPDLIDTCNMGILSPHPQTRIVSKLVNPDRQPVAPLMTLCENKLGGRVAVMALNLSQAFGPAFLHPFRQEQLQTILQWLARDKLPATVTGGVYPLAYRMDTAEHIILGVFNLSHDDWPDVTWTLHANTNPTTCQILDKDGTWTTAPCHYSETPQQQLKINVPRALSFRRPMIMKMRTQGSAQSPGMVCRN